MNGHILDGLDAAAPVLALVALLGAVAVAGTGYWAWALVDAVKRPVTHWEATNQNKTAWLVGIAVFGAIGGLLYATTARPALRRVEAAAATTFDPTAFGVPHGGMTRGADGFQPQF